VLTQPRSSEDHKNLIERGFTLVELLIVIVILGILAGIVVFAVGNLTNNATNHACATEMQTFETAVQSWYAQNPGGTLNQAGAPNNDAAHAMGYAQTLFNANLLASGTVGYYVGGPNGNGNNTWAYTAGGAGVPGTVAGTGGTNTTCK
jgi:prepilin-type N-terminal cleavage/methylation domain-containing protein